MTRSEYLAELDSHLISLPKEERDMAISFYAEYFDEAGPENEQAVIADLGKPFSLARSIIGETSAYSKSMVYLKYKESKPMPENNTSVFASLRKPEAFEEKPPVDDTAEDIMPNGMNNQSQPVEKDVFPNENQSGMFDDDYIKSNSPEIEEHKKSSNTTLIIILIIIGAIIGLPVICSIAGVAIGIVAAMFAIGIAAAVCFVAAIIVFISGLIQLPVSVPNALGFIFAGILTSGIGMLLLSASLAFFFRFIPWIFRGITKLIRKRRAE